VTAPILEGDPMVVVLVVEDPRFTYDSLRLSGRSGHDDVWRPVSLPLRGAYGDFGLLVDWDDGVAVHFAERVTKLPMADLMDPDREGEVTLGGNPGGPKISTATFHADLFGRMAERTRDVVGAPIHRDHELDRIPAFLANAAEISKTSPLAGVLPAGTPGISLNALPDVYGSWARTTGEHWSKAPYVARFFDTGRCSQHPVLTEMVRDLLQRAHDAGDADRVEEVLASALSLQFVDANMGLLAREWAPVVTGGQDLNVDLHREVADWTVARCDALDRGRDFGGPSLLGR
jgi:hypothetical protein